jgi:hypothetical protein
MGIDNSRSLKKRRLDLGLFVIVIVCFLLVVFFGWIGIIQYSAAPEMVETFVSLKGLTLTLTSITDLDVNNFRIGYPINQEILGYYLINKDLSYPVVLIGPLRERPGNFYTDYEIETTSLSEDNNLKLVWSKKTTLLIPSIIITAVFTVLGCYSIVLFAFRRKKR